MVMKNMQAWSRANLNMVCVFIIGFDYSQDTFLVDCVALGLSTGWHRAAPNDDYATFPSTTRKLYAAHHTEQERSV